MAQTVKNLPAMRETRVRSLCREDPLEKEMATYSSILAWRIPWTEEPGRLYSPWNRKELGQEWATFTFIIIERTILDSPSKWINLACEDLTSGNQHVKHQYTLMSKGMERRKSPEVEPWKHLGGERTKRPRKSSRESSSEHQRDDRRREQRGRKKPRLGVKKWGLCQKTILNLNI